MKRSIPYSSTPYDEDADSRDPVIDFDRDVDGLEDFRRQDASEHRVETDHLEERNHEQIKKGANEQAEDMSRAEYERGREERPQDYSRNCPACQQPYLSPPMCIPANDGDIHLTFSCQSCSSKTNFLRVGEQLLQESHPHTSDISSLLLPPTQPQSLLPTPGPASAPPMQPISPPILQTETRYQSENSPNNHSNSSQPSTRSTSSRLPSSRPSGADKKWFCPVCNAGFTQKGSLRRHAVLHKNIKPHQCKQCAKAFPRHDQLKIHERTHLQTRPFPCDSCGRGFLTRRDQERHEKTHNNTKAYPCPDCKRRFHRKEDLQNHCRTHRPELRLKCTRCDKSYTDQKGVKRHFRRVHSDEVSSK